MTLDSIDCWKWPNLLNLIVGSIFTVILVGLVFLASLATVNYAPVPYDLFATSTAFYRIAFYCALMFMTVNENLIAKSIPVVGHWWEALFNLIVISALLVILVYYLPFQVRFNFTF
jgi:hypothetical protein